MQLELGFVYNANGQRMLYGCAQWRGVWSFIPVFFSFNRRGRHPCSRVLCENFSVRTIVCLHVRANKSGMMWHLSCMRIKNVKETMKRLYWFSTVFSAKLFSHSAGAYIQAETSFISSNVNRHFYYACVVNYTYS